MAKDLPKILIMNQVNFVKKYFVNGSWSMFLYIDVLSFDFNQTCENVKS